MSFGTRIKLSAFRKVNGKIRNPDTRILAFPVSGLKGAFAVHDDLSSKSKISVEPSVPEPTSISLDRQLLEAKALEL